MRVALDGAHLILAHVVLPLLLVRRELLRRLLLLRLALGLLLAALALLIAVVDDDRLRLLRLLQLRQRRRRGRARRPRALGHGTSRRHARSGSRRARRFVGAPTRAAARRRPRCTVCLRDGLPHTKGRRLPLSQTHMRRAVGLLALSLLAGVTGEYEDGGSVTLYANKVRGPPAAGEERALFFSTAADAQSRVLLVLARRGAPTPERARARRLRLRAAGRSVCQPE